MPSRDDLHQLLSTYQTTDPIEMIHQQRMLTLLDGPGDPFSRGHFDPGHFTASAFILSPDGGSLLLIHHAKLHRWLQPGGHVETADADLLATAARETAEEVGMTALPLAQPGIYDLDIHLIPARKSEPAHEHFDVRFLFRAPSLDFIAGSDAKACKWVPLENITAELTDESVMRAIRKIGATL
jgi:8-oxo-dGTP pyrophosphatase MutT (NUDIX family)